MDEIELTGPFFVEAEDETEYYTWRLAHVECDPSVKAITIHGVGSVATPTITIPICEIAEFEIVSREGISTLPSVALGALLADYGTGLGCLLSLILAPVAIVDKIIATRTRFPVIKLTQSVGDGAPGWTLSLRSKRRGQRGRGETRELANRLAGVLRESGYNGLLPDLSAHELWFEHREIR